MGLLQKLKSALGLDGAGSSDRRRSGDVDVTVEREPSTETEDAVKGTETRSDDATTADAEPESTAVSAADSDTAATADEAPGESVTDTDDTVATEVEPPVEEAEDTTAEPTTDEEETATDADEPADDEEETATDADEPADDESDESAAAGSDDPVTELNGIGPAYADRLAGLDIETVGELAVADAADVAAETDLGEKRVSDWIAQAEQY